MLKSKAKHAAIAAKLRKPFKFENHPLIVQYEIAFQVKFIKYCLLVVPVISA